MNMRMTIIVFVVVATAATVVGSTPLEERGSWPTSCCIRKTIECVRYKCLLTPLLCTPFCYSKGATARCGGDPDEGCCPAFFGCYISCLRGVAGKPFACYKTCRDVDCEL
uniref:Conotoxin-like unassigned superfamily 14 n=1 Tax=Conus ermineus TaxID=55423 RepID=A0A346CIN5_CONER|nr:conotoxin-like precursor unassigned superfamily 14 [Conus ermineus]